MTDKNICRDDGTSKVVWGGRVGWKAKRDFGVPAVWGAPVEE